MPDAFIGVDVIVGFNGETEEHFNDSYEFIKSLDVTRLHVFPYSPRPNTAALAIKPYIQNGEKKRRTDILMDFSEKRLHEFMQAQIGKSAKVLWEDTDSNIMHGFTENYIRVSAPYDASKINSIELPYLSLRRLISLSRDSISLNRPSSKLASEIYCEIS